MNKIAQNAGLLEERVTELEEVNEGRLRNNRFRVWLVLLVGVATGFTLLATVAGVVELEGFWGWLVYMSVFVLFGSVFEKIKEDLVSSHKTTMEGMAEVMRTANRVALERDKAISALNHLGEQEDNNTLW